MKNLKRCSLNRKLRSGRSRDFPVEQSTERVEFLANYRAISVVYFDGLTCVVSEQADGLFLGIRDAVNMAETIVSELRNTSPVGGPGQQLAAMVPGVGHFSETIGIVRLRQVKRTLTLTVSSHFVRYVRRAIKIVVLVDHLVPGLIHRVFLF